MSVPTNHPDVAYLVSSAAIRERCEQIFELCARNELPHFQLNLDCLDKASEYVLKVIKESYPSLDIPYHSRWRHFEAVDRTRFSAFEDALRKLAPSERVRAKFDLTTVSVLLDAGAGNSWRYVEPGTGRVFTRSEGLAVSTFHMFCDGLFSGRSGDPYRADATRLAAISEGELTSAFMADDANPLAGLDGRTRLMNRLGRTLQLQQDYFGTGNRPGSLADNLPGSCDDGSIRASDLLSVVLKAFGPIWPGRLELHGVNLGDVWQHPMVKGEGATNGLVPFHKLSQWLTYSLVEPLEEGGIAVRDLNDLTGLAEYRNGGLFIDTGVITFRDESLRDRGHSADSEVVVAWRALTVSLLDRLADRIRTKLRRSADDFSLARVLEGGTWKAGRRIARELRADGRPPLKVISDGTVF